MLERTLPLQQKDSTSQKLPDDSKNVELPLDLLSRDKDRKWLVKNLDVNDPDNSKNLLNALEFKKTDKKFKNRTTARELKSAGITPAEINLHAKSSEKLIALAEKSKSSDNKSKYLAIAAANLKANADDRAKAFKLLAEMSYQKTEGILKKKDENQIRLWLHYTIAAAQLFHPDSIDKQENFIAKRAAMITTKEADAGFIKVLCEHHYFKHLNNPAVENKAEEKNNETVLQPETKKTLEEENNEANKALSAIKELYQAEATFHSQCQILTTNLPDSKQLNGYISIYKKLEINPYLFEGIQEKLESISTSEKIKALELNKKHELIDFFIQQIVTSFQSEANVANLEYIREASLNNEAFVNHSEFKKHAETYLVNRVVEFEKLKKNVQYIEQSLSFPAIAPIQRGPRYKLHFSEIKKHLSYDSKLYATVQQLETEIHRYNIETNNLNIARRIDRLNDFLRNVNKTRGLEDLQQELYDNYAKIAQQYISQGNRPLHPVPSISSFSRISNNSPTPQSPLSLEPASPEQQSAINIDEKTIIAPTKVEPQDHLVMVEEKPQAKDAEIQTDDIDQQSNEEFQNQLNQVLKENKRIVAESSAIALLLEEQQNKNKLLENSDREQKSQILTLQKSNINFTRQSQAQQTKITSLEETNARQAEHLKEMKEHIFRARALEEGNAVLNQQNIHLRSDKSDLRKKNTSLASKLDQSFNEREELLNSQKPHPLKKAAGMLGFALGLTTVVLGVCALCALPGGALAGIAFLAAIGTSAGIGSVVAGAISAIGGLVVTVVFALT